MPVQLIQVNTESVTYSGGTGTWAFATGEGGGDQSGASAANLALTAMSWNSAAVDTTGSLALVLSVITGPASANCETKFYDAFVVIE